MAVVLERTVRDEILSLTAKDITLSPQLFRIVSVWLRAGLDHLLVSHTRERVGVQAVHEQVQQ